MLSLYYFVSSIIPPPSFVKRILTFYVFWIFAQEPADAKGTIAATEKPPAARFRAAGGTTQAAAGGARPARRRVPNSNTHGRVPNDDTTAAYTTAAPAATPQSPQGTTAKIYFTLPTSILSFVRSESSLIGCSLSCHRLSSPHSRMARSMTSCVPAASGFPPCTRAL